MLRLFMQLNNTLRTALHTLNRPDATPEQSLAALEVAATLGHTCDADALASWVAQGPWANNPPFLYTFMRKHLQLVNARQTPLAHALREYCKDEWNSTIALVKDPAIAWCLNRPLNSNEVLNTLRSSRRWCLRGASTVVDACASWDAGNAWQGVYIYGLWRAKTEQGLRFNALELQTLSEHFHADSLLYWLDAAASSRHELCLADSLPFARVAAEDANVLQCIGTLKDMDVHELGLRAWAAVQSKSMLALNSQFLDEPDV